MKKEKVQLTYNNKTIEVELEADKLQELVGKKKARPEIGEKYFIIGLSGDVVSMVWENDSYESGVWDSGNGFLTEEEADKELARRQARRKIKDFIIENGLEFEPDWHDEGQVKNFIKFNNTEDYFFYDTYISLSLVGVEFYFKSREDAQMVIDNCEEELRVLL